jgi:tight adherence protein B
MTVTWLAAVAGACAAALLVPARPVLPGQALGAARVLGVGLPLGVLVLLPFTSVRTAGLLLIAAGCLVGTRSLLRRRRRRHALMAGQAMVLAFCQVVAAELAAGQAPGSALRRGADECPVLAPVATEFELGGDVPQALRRAARTAGHQDLALAAAAWQVSQRTGGGLSSAMVRVGTGLRATQATRRVVNGELSSARATARLMAGLPVLALLMGRGIGADPLSFLFGSAAGLWCLAGGLGFGFVGLWWIEAIADGVTADPSWVG